jgi:NAD(P)-dependent dehydrogenase (short-subunit alcohol dehydrogenase family)
MTRSAHGGRWTAADVPGQPGKTAVVTGASSGLGLEIAGVLAARGATVVLACRDTGRAGQAAGLVRAGAGPAGVRVVRLDLASLASVREAADEIRSSCPRLDLLINNAGVMRPPYQRSGDGFELTFATNHLGHFALTGLVLDRLLETPGSRVVTVSSVGHWDGVMRFDDLQFERGYRADDAYAQSKLANLLFTYELAARLRAAGSRTIALAAHPGWPAPRCSGGTRGRSGRCSARSCARSCSGWCTARGSARSRRCGPRPTRPPGRGSITAPGGGTGTPATRSGWNRAPARTMPPPGGGCGRSPSS